MTIDSGGSRPGALGTRSRTGRWNALWLAVVIAGVVMLAVRQERNGRHNRRLPGRVSARLLRLRDFARRNEEDARSLVMIAVSVIYLALLLGLSRPSFFSESMPDWLRLILLVLIVPPLLVSLWCAPEQRDRWAMSVWVRVARPARRAQQMPLIRRASAAVMGWKLPSAVLALNTLSAASSPGVVSGWHQVEGDEITSMDRVVVIVAYPVANAILILLSVCVLGALIAGYRHGCLRHLFDRTTGWRAWLRTIAPIAPLRLPPLVWRTFAGAFILALFADLARAVGNAALESVAIGAIVAVVYAWSFRPEFDGVRG